MYRQLPNLFLLLLTSFMLSQDAFAARKVSANRECATCHVMWLTEFNQNELKPLIKYDPTPIVNTGKQDVASTERMCFSCHDGFVLDSRFMWKQGGHNHPVGVIPSDNVKIPTVKGKNIFPLNHDGKLYCGSCHTAHGVDWKDDESPIFLREKNVNSSLCMACHLDRSTGPKHGNHPIFKSLPEYPDKLKQQDARFSKNKEVICQTCHKPHAAGNDKILLLDNKQSGLCISCHKEKKSILASKHNMTLSAKELQNGQGKTAAESGPCASCHIPHYANGPTLWSRTVNKTLSDPASATCLSCHNNKDIVKEKTIGNHSHPLGRSIKQLDIMVSKGKWSSEKHGLAAQTAPLPLFDKQGQRSDDGNLISCASCHDPHIWSQDHTQKATTDIDGDATNSFLRIADSLNSPLCLTCHLDKKSIRNSKHDINRKQNAFIKTAKTGASAGNNMPSEIKSSVNKHASLCSHCHTPHNAKGGSLRARGDRKDTAPIESLCRDCHEFGGLATDKAIASHSHPLNVSPVNMKDKANLPLFDAQGYRQQKDGVIDCTTCHDPHRWSQSKQQDADSEGDGSNSFLRTPTAKDSRLCRQCHTDKASVINTDHDLSVTSARNQNGLGQTVATSGPCAQCHAIHNPKMLETLWSRSPGEGQDPIERQCRSCHDKDGPASNKVPPALQHPKSVTVWSEKSRKVYKDHTLPKMPVFDQHAKRSETGSISCASCHDPHTWSTDPNRRKENSARKNIEGDAMSSFLRNSNSSYIVCADCHGEDAIYRYKYFHSEASRIKHPLYK